MDFTGYRYYKPNKFFLSMIGLWPYRTTRFGLIHFCCYLTMFSAFVPQVIPLVRSKDATDILLKNLPSLSFYVMSFARYSIFVEKTNVMEILLGDVKRDWKEIRSNEELRIYKKYASVGRIQTIAYAGFVYGCGIGLLIITTAPGILNILRSQSTPCSMKLPFVVDYLLDGEKYNVFIVAHSMLSMIFTLTVLWATESMFFMFVKHACGLFNVARCQIVQAFSSSFMRPLLPAQKSTIYGAVVKAIHDHKKAQKFTAVVQKHFVFLYTVQILLGVILLTGNLYRLSQVFVLDSVDSSELLMVLSLTIGQLVVMFYINHESEQVMEECYKFFIYPYRTEWYEAPLYIQKVLLAILAFDERIKVFDLYGIYSPSVEGFASHFRLSWSYFMMLHSMQQR